MPGLTLVRVHELDAVKEIVRQATEIADEAANTDEARIAVFNKAVDLLAARIPIVPQEPLGFDLSALRGPRI